MQQTRRPEFGPPPNTPCKTQTPQTSIQMQLEQHGQEHRLHPVRRVQLLRMQPGSPRFLKESSLQLGFGASSPC